MPVNQKAKKIYNNIFDGSENFASNNIIRAQEYLSLYRNIDKKNKLTKSQKKHIKIFWSPYERISHKWAQYYSAKNNNFDPRYIPNSLYYTKIDQYFNSKKLGYGFNDKNYYSKIFDGVDQPKTIVRKINNILFDSEYKLIKPEDAKREILKHNEVICKPSQETGSGRGIDFIETKDNGAVDDIICNPLNRNIVIQELIKQHNELDKIHLNSINSLRICSILLKDGVHILSSVLRMGFGQSRVDNATSLDNKSYDGMSCGIDKEGKLKKYAYGYYKGNKMSEHPDGLVFEGFKVPSYEKAIEMVKDCHQRIGNFRLVSWDIAIQYDGKPILIEANMRKGSINFHQFNNGPLFGELTERILNEVYGK